MCFTLLRVFRVLSPFLAEKLQPFPIRNCSLKEPPGPTATFQGTSKNRPEAPKEHQGAPKSSQRASRAPSGSTQESIFLPSLLPPSSLFLPPSLLPPPSFFPPPSFLPAHFENFCQLFLANQSVHQSWCSLQGAGGMRPQAFRIFMLFLACPWHCHRYTVWVQT